MPRFSTGVKWVSIAALAAIAGALAFFALQKPPVPNAGEFPTTGTVATTPATAPRAEIQPPTPAASPSSGQRVTAGDQRFLDSWGDSGVIRATAGLCGEKLPDIELSIDGGVSWSIANIPPTVQVSQVLGVAAISPERIDVVVMTGPECRLDVLSSFTAGQFWELFPERLSELTFLEPTNNLPLQIAGVASESPCAVPLQLARPSAEGPAALVCEDGVYLSDDGSQPWNRVSSESVDSFDIDLSTPEVAAGIAVAAENLTCSGISLRTISLASLGLPDDPLSCIQTEGPELPVVIKSEPGAWLLWSGDEFRVSNDRGISWTRR
jgi:hypothetical protein